MYKVSLGIPIYNSAAYIERALSSALNQTFPDIEYILVDDRGTDNSMDIVRRMIAAHPRGKDARIIVHEVNGGPGVARDTMMANATAPYIYFMDNDDELAEDAIALLYDAMEQFGGAQVVRGIHKYIPIGSPRPDCLDRSAKGYIEKKGVEVIQAYPDLFFAGVINKLYDLDFLRREKIHFGDLRLGEDSYFSMQVACKAQRFIYIPYVTYFNYEIPSSLSACFRERRYDAHRMESNKRLYGQLLDFGLSLVGEVRLTFEQKMLEILYTENRYVLQSSGLPRKGKRRYIGELDALFQTYPFRGNYWSLKGRLFWILYRMPMPLRVLLIRARNLLV